jgi:hypothetical protein
VEAEKLLSETEMMVREILGRAVYNQTA